MLIDQRKTNEKHLRKIANLYSRKKEATIKPRAESSAASERNETAQLQADSEAAQHEQLLRPVRQLIEGAAQLLAQAANASEGPKQPSGSSDFRSPPEAHRNIQGVRTGDVEATDPAETDSLVAAQRAASAILARLIFPNAAVLGNLDPLTLALYQNAVPACDEDTEQATGEKRSSACEPIDLSLKRRKAKS